MAPDSATALFAETIRPVVEHPDIPLDVARGMYGRYFGALVLTAAERSGTSEVMILEAWNRGTDVFGLAQVKPLGKREPVWTTIFYRGNTPVFGVAIPVPTLTTLDGEEGSKLLCFKSQVFDGDMLPPLDTAHPLPIDYMLKWELKPS